jgi:hypothetical protein
MSKRLNINIVYSPQKGDPHKVFENHKGEIWHSKTKLSGKHNIGMGWYSIRNPKPQDSILVLEPFCVLPRDYRKDFVRKFKYVFTWAVKALHYPVLRKKIIEINHPSCRDLLARKHHSKTWLPWDKRADEIVFIANNKSSTHESELYTLRRVLADFLDKHSKYKVSWYGQIPLNKPYFRGKLQSKHRLLQQVKFSVCTENCYHKIYSHNYFTEKMPEVWGAGAVPLYIGCHNIDKFKYPKESYMDLREYLKLNNKNSERGILKDKLLNCLNSYSREQYNAYARSILTNVLTENALLSQISYNNMYKKIINTFHSSK